ncbi:biliverdin-producing heme oxygenase [Methylobacterium sp. ID0610]|uniref:biliverdin-producing heme oxygenase n=1 Tax=Methylobacterium carpenticola TaxID=3344827 RepID=UPI00369F2F18
MTNPLRDDRDGPGPGATAEPERLSLRLRDATREAHERVEALSGLPDSIRDRADYATCLAAMLGVWGPIERDLRRWPDWEALGLEPAGRARGPLLEQDLMELQVGAEAVPAVPVGPSGSFAEALGRLYVLEGSALGGRLILAALRRRPDLDLGEATRFFDGRGSDTGRLWGALRTALDRFGDRDPRAGAAVIRGAHDAFAAFAAAFARHRGARNEAA